MQRLQTCELPNDFRHVCFKDLQGYISVDNFLDALKGFSSIELNEIRKILGVPENIYVDKNINMCSTNPVENRAVFDALSNKVDKNKIADVAITGCYRDLKGTPIHLPNPEGLVIQDQNGEYKVYDGSEAIKVTIPQQIKDFSDWKEFVVDYQAIERMIPIKNIALNGVIVPVNSDKVVSLNTITWDEISKKLKNYITADQLEQVQGNILATLSSEIDRLHASIDSEITTVKNNTQSQINALNQSLTNTNQSVQDNAADILDVRNKIADLTNRIDVLEKALKKYHSDDNE